jgi:hypothetical protein
MDQQKRVKDIKFAAWSIAGAFLTYFSMYAFRKPFSAGTYEGMVIWGMDYKIMLVTFQVAGYTLSKFMGIKLVSEMKPERRVVYILGLIGVSWLALLAFALVPAPYNVWCLFFNGLPLGMIWGLVFGFLEGRRQTELLAAGLASSFIVSSGFVKSTGRSLVLEGVSEYWMPWMTGLLFVPLLLLGLFLLSRIPQPGEADIVERTVRQPMTAAERRRFFIQFAPGIVLTTLIYMGLNAYRDFRDNFAVEIWNALGFAAQPEMLTLSEIPIAVLVLVLAGAMFLIRRARPGFYISFFMILFGGITLILATWMFTRGVIGPVTWMIAAGFGMYLPYMFYHTMLFERWIALFKTGGNIGFLMYIADSFGYLASVAVMLYKDFFVKDLSWLHFFTTFSFITGFAIILLGLLAFAYFLKKEKDIHADPQPGWMPAR